MSEQHVSIGRWTRLWSAFVAMVMIGNLQYAWTLFAEPIVKAHSQQHWHLSQVQWGFGVFIAAGCWAMPAFASTMDHKGPRGLMALSGVLCAVGWSYSMRRWNFPWTSRWARLTISKSWDSATTA
jgi:MFS family permease